MSERYKILDSIMANPDPMIRQRLEMAYDAGRVSVLHEKNVFADDKDFDCAVTFHTAFTNRDIAILTARVEELEAENKRLKEALEEIQGYGEVEVNPQHDRDVGNDLNACVRIARKALANKTEKAKSMDALLKEMTEGQDEQR